MVVAAVVAGLSTTVAAATSAAAETGGGAPATASARLGALAAAMVNCRTLGRNRRPPLVRTMGCRSGRLRERRCAQARATIMRKVTKKTMRMGVFKEEDGHAKGLGSKISRRQQKFSALCEILLKRKIPCRRQISRTVRNFAQPAPLSALNPPAGPFPK